MEGMDGTGGTMLREVRARRFHVMGLGGAAGAVGAAYLTLATPQATPVVGWIIVADAVLLEFFGLRRAFPGGYARLTADGIAARRWKSKKEGFVAWSEISAVEVKTVGFGREGYRYPDLRLADGRHAPMLMLASGLIPTGYLAALVLRRFPYDESFDAKFEALQSNLEAFRARTADPETPLPET